MNRSRDKFDRGWWQTQRERLQIADAVPPPGPAQDVEIGAILPSILKNLRLTETAWKEDLAARWPSIAGAAVAKHCRPGRLDGFRLIVFVDSSVWLSELARNGRQKLLGNIQAQVGKDRVKSVDFALDPEGGTRKQAPKP